MSIPTRPYALHSSVEPLEARIAPANVIVTNAGPTSISEDGSQNLVFTFTRDGSTAESLAVEFYVNGAGAPNGVTAGGPNNDFTVSTAGGVSLFSSPDKYQFTFAPGESQKSVTIAPVTDVTIEGNESLTVSVNTSNENYTAGTPGTSTATIVDNDFALVQFNTFTHSVAESTTTVDVSVTLTTFGNGVPGAAALPSTLYVDVNDLLTGSATAGSDYSFTNPTTLVFSAGDTGSTKLATISIIDDPDNEADETIDLQLGPSNGGSSLAAPTAPPGITINANIYTETILANDVPPATVGVQNLGLASAPENGPAKLVYTFSRTGATDTSLVVNFSTFGSAQAATDYGVSGTDVIGNTTSGSYNGTGTITFLPGEASKTLTIDAVNDVLVEGSEFLSVGITAGAYAIDGQHASASGTLADDDTATIAFATVAHSTKEGEFAQIAVTLSTVGNGVAGQGQLVSSVLVDVSDLGTGTATSGLDYATFNLQTLTFQAGDHGSTQNVSVLIYDDRLTEGAETIKFALSPHTVINGFAASPGSPVNIDTQPHTETILPSDAHFYAFSNSRQGGAIGKGSAPVVRIFEAGTGEEQPSIMAFEKSYRDGVRVAIGDVNGDGNDDIVVATRDGTGRIRAFDGLTHSRINFGEKSEIAAFTGKGAHGAYVALGDFFGEGQLEIIVGSGLGGGDVKIFSSIDGSLMGTRTPFAGYKGGIRIAAGDFNGDGRADIVAGMGQLGSMVKIIASGENPDITFQAGPSKLRDGVFVAVGDVSPSGPNEIIVGRGKQGNPGQASVGVFSLFSRPTITGSDTPTEIHTIPLSNTTYQYGARVAATDLTGDGLAEIIVGAGHLGGSQVQFFDGESFAEITSKATLAFATAPKLGVFVAGSVPIPVQG